MFLDKIIIYIQKRYYVHVLEKCLYVLQEVRFIIYFQQFIHPLSLMFLNSFFHLIFVRSRTRRYRVSSSCSNVLISMTLFGKKDNSKVSTYALDNTHSFCYLMIVLMRAVLSTKLVLRYKYKFEAIVLGLVSKLSDNKLLFYCVS